MSRSAVIETLEDRRLLSASPLATKSKIPSMLGTFTGTESYSSGVIYSVIIAVKKQHGEVFSGTVVESSGLTARINGTIDRSDNVRFTEVSTKRHHPFSSTVVGTLSSDSLSATFTKSQSGLRFHGSIASNRPTTTTT
jgi:hypothetical protein